MGDQPDNCGAAATSIIAAFAALGQYGTAAVGHCSPTSAAAAVGVANADILACANHASEALRYTTAFSAAASLMAQTCQKSHERLKLYTKQLASAAPHAKKSPASSIITFVLSASLPLAVV